MKKKRNPIARDLLQPKYRQRIRDNINKRFSKTLEYLEDDHEEN